MSSSVQISLPDFLSIILAALISSSSMLNPVFSDAISRTLALASSAAFFTAAPDTKVWRDA